MLEQLVTSPAEVRRICLEGETTVAAGRLLGMGLDTHDVWTLLQDATPQTLTPGRRVVDLFRSDGVATKMVVHIPHLAGRRPGALVFLHGAGSDGERVADVAADLGEASGCVVLCPSAASTASRATDTRFALGGLFGHAADHARWHWSSEDYPLLALRWAYLHLNVDRNRCSIAGHSMGAVATWNLTARHWHQFCAAVPINGAISVWELFGADDDAELLKPNLMNVPIKAIHGTADRRIPMSLERATIEYLTRLGHHDATQIAVEGGEHHLGSMAMCSGSDHYDAVASWLLAQSRRDWPTHVRHQLLDQSHGRAHWVEVERHPEARFAAVEAHAIKRDMIDVKVSGAARVILHLHQRLFSPGEIDVVINGKPHRRVFEPRMHLCVSSYRSTLDPGLMAEDRASFELIGQDEAREEGRE